METDEITTQKKGQISDNEFIRTWQEGKTAAEVAEALGRERQSVIQRACTLRTKGVLLKKFPSAACGREARTPEYYSELNKLAAEYGPLSAPKNDADETDEDSEN